MPTPQITQYEDLRKEVARRYEQLHPDVKAALVSVDTAGAVYEIGKKFGLNIEKTGHLADVIGYTIIGLLPVADFTQNLKDALEVDGAKAEEISREVNAKIFLAIREQLKKTHGEKWDERAMTAARTANGKEQMVKEPTSTVMPVTPMAPKSPWEIRPDGFSKPHEQPRTVVPPAREQPRTATAPTLKVAEAEAKKAAPMPPEFPKTREAPQPAPAPQSVGVLKEIRPLQPTTYNPTGPSPRALGQQPTTTPKPEMPKVVPPADLPFMKEVGRITQTPELEKPAVQKQPETQKPSQPQPVPQPTLAPKPQPPQEVPQQKPQAPLQTPVSTPTQKYVADPYREPIE